MLKKIFSKNNMFYFLLVGVFVSTQGSAILNNFKTQGAEVASLNVETLVAKGESSKMVKFPPKGRSIAIFWSSTCGPCKLEMSRLSSSVEDGKIPKESLFAINSFESKKDIQKFLSKNKYPFTFVDFPHLGSILGVRATPTTIFIEDGKIVSMKSGISITGIWSAENFLD